MRLPELPGYRYQALLGEDPFGWSYVCSLESGEMRMLKVLKEQAVNERLLLHYWEELGREGVRIPGAAPVLDRLAASAESPAAVVGPLFGWRSGESGAWQISSLARLMPLLSAEQALEVLHGLARCLDSVHRARLFHGGLRPASIYLNGDAASGQRVQIGDFGQMVTGGLQQLVAGDLLFYASPEQIASGDFSGGRGEAWDVYAFGVVAFQLLTGHLPRLDLLRQQCLARPGVLDNAPAILFGELTPVAERFLSQLDREKPVEWPEGAVDTPSSALREIVESCLRFDPADRPRDMSEVCAALGEASARRDRPEAKEASAEIPGTAGTAAAGAQLTGPGTAEDAEEEAPTLVTRSDSSASAEGGAGLPDSGDAADLEAAAPAPTAQSQSGAEGGENPEPGDAGAAPVEALPQPSRPGRGRGRVGAWFAARPALKWQLAAVFSGAAALVLGALAFHSHREYRKTKIDLTTEQAELQADVDRQARAYSRILSEKQKNAEQLEANLNEVEDSNSRLMGEATLARQVLRQAQDNGDRFFRLVLDNRDTDVPGFREERAKSLEQGRLHYERLVEVYGNAPDFIVSTANALFFLGCIYKETGEFGKALASFGEAERRYLALLEDSRTFDVEFVRNLAIAKRSLGELSYRTGKFAVARHYYTESSRYWAEARSQAPAEAFDAGIRLHENSLAIAECELAMNRGDAALDGARSIAMQLIDLQEQNPDDHRVVGALAKSFAISARVLETGGEAELAKEAYQEASDLYAQAVRLNAAVDRYRIGLGGSLARLGLLTNDLTKLESSAELLAELVAANPHEDAYQSTLAEVYGALAGNQRDGGQLENAVKLERKALAMLEPLVEKEESASLPVLFAYSQRLSHLAEMLGDEGSFDESREPLKEAIAVLERISSSEQATAAHRRALARARGLAGFASLKSGDRSGAREHLELARSAWEVLANSNPDDDDAARAVQWTKDQLRTLR